MPSQSYFGTKYKRPHANRMSCSWDITGISSHGRGKIHSKQTTVEIKTLFASASAGGRNRGRNCSGRCARDTTYARCNGFFLGGVSRWHGRSITGSADVKTIGGTLCTNSTLPSRSASWTAFARQMPIVCGYEIDGQSTRNCSSSAGTIVKKAKSEAEQTTRGASKETTAVADDAAGSERRKRRGRYLIFFP